MGRMVGARGAREMSELLDTLKAKYPRWKVISEPDSDCSCAGKGERRTNAGVEYPCPCVCLSEIEGWSRAEFVRGIGNAARRIMNKETAK